MINYNEYDMPGLGLVELLENLGGKEPTEEEVWEKARNNVEVPNFENIYTNILFERLENAVNIDMNSQVDIDYEVNCAASYFMINGEHIKDMSDYSDVTYNFDKE